MDAEGLRFSFHVAGASVSEVCSASELEPFQTNTWLIAVGPLSYGAGSFGLSFGAGGGIGKAKCFVRLFEMAYRRQFNRSFNMDNLKDDTMGSLLVRLGAVLFSVGAIAIVCAMAFGATPRSRAAVWVRGALQRQEDYTRAGWNMYRGGLALTISGVVIIILAFAGWSR